MSDIASLLTIDAFRAWLDSHDNYDIVGEAQSPCGCPIAEFLKDNGHSVEVTHKIYIGEETVPLPEWAAQFIEAIDEEVRDLVHVWEARRYLNEVTP